LSKQEQVPEEKLLERIKNNPAVFSELFDLYYKPIFGYILRRTADFDDTADIASETFLKAFNNVPKFNHRGISIKVWLYRIATNEVNLHFRNQKKSKRLFENNAMDEPELFQSYLQLDRQVLEKELLLHAQYLSVVAQLKQLPVKYQNVIALRYFEGKDNREIAEILDLKEGTLKSLLSRGLEKLKNLCKETAR
jgi:RNA polymerase sigma factor (sigma-70 family)